MWSAKVVGLLWKPTRVSWTGLIFELAVNLVQGRFNICSGPWVGPNRTRFQLNGIRLRQTAPKETGSSVPITKLCRQWSLRLKWRRRSRHGFSRRHCGSTPTAAPKRRQQPFAPGDVFSHGAGNGTTTHGDCASHRHLKCLKTVPKTPLGIPANDTWNAVWNGAWTTS